MTSPPSAARAADRRQPALPLPPGRLLLPLLPGALCKGRDPGLWFPPPGGSPNKAKAVCRACPARTRCLEWAVQADERAGVWGGTTADERAPLRRQRSHNSQRKEPS